MKYFLELLILVCIISLNSLLYAQSQYPPGVEKINYFCSADSSYQPAMFYVPAKKQVPLLVGLHPWSSDYTNYHGIEYSSYCVNHEWAFIFPNFRGKNNNPDATGSDLAVRDIADAVKFCISNYDIDTSRIYLAGASGGGHAALLTAGKMPSIWAGVTAWVPITDLGKWYEESEAMGTGYWWDIHRSCGGNPLTDSAASSEAYKRSPINYLSNAKNVAIDINAGIHDGHNGYAVPISQSLAAFNKLAFPEDTISRAEIDYFVNAESVPPDLSSESTDDPIYGSKKVLFRRTSGNARITIFDGVHEIIFDAALAWLSQQNRKPTHVKLPGKQNGSITFKLFDAYPNPFNPSTTIAYVLPRAGIVELNVYDALGRKVSELVNERQESGLHEVLFNSGTLSSGVYFYRLENGLHIAGGKMILIK